MYISLLNMQKLFQTHCKTDARSYIILFKFKLKLIISDTNVMIKIINVVLMQIINQWNDEVIVKFDW